MPSKIQVDQIAGATGNTVTLPSGQTLDLSSGTVTLPSASLSALNATNLTSGTVPNARLSGITADKLDLISTASVPSVTAKGTVGVTDGYIQLNCEQNSHGIKLKSPPHSAGANYTMVMPNAIGTANQVLRMNSGATALEFATVSAGKLLKIQTAVATSAVSASTAFSSYSGGTLPSNLGTSFITISFTPTSASSKLVVMANAPFGLGGNSLGLCNVTHNNDTIGAFMANGYSGDATGATITAFVASGSTSARNISFRVVGGWSGETVTLGALRGSTATAMTAGVFGTMIILEIEP